MTNAEKNGTQEFQNRPIVFGEFSALWGSVHAKILSLKCAEFIWYFHGLELLSIFV
jgi:hypothetical protein